MIEDDTYISNPSIRPVTVPKYVGPYAVVYRTKNGPYALRDSTGLALKRHVNIDQMKVLFRAGVHKPKVPVPEGEESYEIEEVLAHDDTGQEQEYKVKWKNYPLSEATWEPITMFDDYACVERYWKQVMLKEAEADKKKKPVAVHHLFYTEGQW